MVKGLKKLILFIYVIYGFSVFLFLMLFVAFVAIICIFLPDRISGNLIYKTCHLWATVWFFLIGISHKIIYENGFDLSKPCIIVANHQSYMDIPVTVHSLNTPYRILAKAEMRKVPIFGLIYKKAAIMVDRTSKLSRAHSYVDLKKALGSGLSVLIYPEGTFNETEDVLSSFYDGAFKLALSMQVPIQPMIILDTKQRLHYKSVFSLRPGRCRTVFLPIHTIERYKEKDCERLKNDIFNDMEVTLNKYLTK